MRFIESRAIHFVPIERNSIRIIRKRDKKKSRSHVKEETLRIYGALKKGKEFPGQPNVIQHDDYYGDVERYLTSSSRHVIVGTAKKRAGQQVRALKILCSAATETRWILNESENRGRA